MMLGIPFIKTYPNRNSTSAAVRVVEAIIKPRRQTIYSFLLWFTLLLLIPLQKEVERSVNQHNEQKQHKRNGEQSVSLQAAGT